MDFINEGSCTDFGAPEYCVTGISSIERISRGQVRVTKYSRRKDGPVALFHEVWDVVEWRAACELLAQVRELIVVEPPLSGADDHPSRAAH